MQEFDHVDWQSSIDLLLAQLHRRYAVTLQVLVRPGCADQLAANALIAWQMEELHQQPRQPAGIVQADQPMDLVQCFLGEVGTADLPARL